jgi:hypothetical protein
MQKCQAVRRGERSRDVHCSCERFLHANSIWAYHLDEAVKARMANLIAGETTEEAKTLLLDQYAGRLADVTFTLQGFGGKLPTEAGAIHLVAQAIAGL